MVAAFEDHRAAVVAQVDKLRRRGSDDGLFQALAVAARAHQETGAPFSAIVAVVADPGMATSTSVRTPILDSGANLHVVLHQETSARDRKNRQPSVDALVALVDATHGQLMTINSPDLYQAAMDRIAKQLATELMVEYLIPAGSVRGNDVQFGVRIAGAKIVSWGIAR